MRAIFLDRDGVINKYPGDAQYVTSWKGFRFLPYAKKAIALLTNKKYSIFVISNQAGVNKGIYSQDTLNDITKRMLEELNKHKGKIAGVYYCTHRDEDNCSCRKPKTGLIEAALKRFPNPHWNSNGNSNAGLEEGYSYFIGDTIRDIQTAKAAGCRSVLVLSGKEKLSHRKNWQIQPDLVFPNLYQAARFIIQK